MNNTIGTLNVNPYIENTTINRIVKLIDKNWKFKTFDLTITNNNIKYQQLDFEPKSFLQKTLVSIISTMFKYQDKYINDLIDWLEEEFNNDIDKEITVSNYDYYKDYISWLDLYDTNKSVTLAIELWLTIRDLEDISSKDWLIFSYWDQEYYVVTEDEWYELEKESIENLIDDIWFNGLFNKNSIELDFKQDISGSFEVIQSVYIRRSERWNNLSSYDWKEIYFKFEWIEYYIYKIN